MEVVNQCLEFVSTQLVCARVALREPNSKHWFTTSFRQPLPYLVTPQGPEKMTANVQFFVGAQTVVNLLQTAQIISDVCFITDHIAFTPAQIKPKSFESRYNSFFFFFSFLPGVDASRVYVRA